MPGLMDTLKQNLTGQPANSPTPAAPALGETQQVAQTLRTKLTGKQTDETGPAQSALGEATAANQTKLGLSQVAQEGKVQGQQLGAQQAGLEQQATGQQAQYQQQMSAQSSNFTNQASQILDTLRTGERNLSTDQILAKTEQAAFMIRGSNDNYVQQLNRQGQLNRLDTQQGFNTETAKMVFADEQDLFHNDAQFKEMMAMDDATFQKSLQKMSDSFAIKIANVSGKAAAATSMYTGVAGVGGAGAQAYGTYSAGQDRQQAQDLSDYNTKQRNAGLAEATPSEFEKIQTRKAGE